MGFLFGDDLPLPVHRDWSLLKRVEWLRGLAVFFAISAPWFVLVSQANPEFARFFFIHEHFERFLTTSHRRYEPWWFFVPILVGGFGPWMLALFPASWRAWRKEDPARAFAWRRFSLIWCGFILLFFSASQSKLPAYILPLFPPLAMLVGEWLDEVDPRRLVPYLLPVALIVAAGLAAMWGWARETGGPASFTRRHGLHRLRLRRRRRRVARRRGVRVAAPQARGDRDRGRGRHRLRRRDGRRLRAAVAAPVGPGGRQVMKLPLTRHRRVFGRVLRPDDPFYLGREVTLAQYVDEGSTGQAEPQRRLPTREAWLADLRPGGAVAIMQPGLYEEVFRPAGLPMTLVHQDERRVVVRKP